MVKPSLFCVSLGLLLFFHGCLCRSFQQFQNECVMNNIESLEPVTRIKSEAGLTEWWNPNDEQLTCVRVSMMRHVIHPHGLVLPSFTNAPQLVYIVQGKGIQGTVMPGCPETFQDSQQYDQQEQSHDLRFQDQHQKIRQVRQGDVIALPAGIVHWAYNDGDEQLVTINLLDTGNSANQLDNNPRKFHLAGDPSEEQRRLSRFRHGSRSEQYQDEQQQKDEDSPKKQSSCSNILSDFDPEILSQAFKLGLETIEKLRCDRGNRGTIVKVKDRLQVIQPPRIRSTHEEHDNGVEETFCSMRINDNIADPERVDVFNPQAGRITTLNSFNLPILSLLGLSAERGVLYKGAGLIPQWTTNAHRIFYMLRGRARFQVVNHNGDAVFDGHLDEGQLLTVPQNFAFLEMAESERAEWVCFYTNDNAMNTHLAGRVSAIRALPHEVIAAAYEMSREEAKRVKFSNQNSFFFMSERRAEA